MGADIGVNMDKNGTDVSKEAADVIVMDDNCNITQSCLL